MSDGEGAGDAAGTRRVLVAALWTVVAIVGVYVGFFLLVLIDESVLGTYWMRDHIPHGANPWLRAIYWPLIELARLLGL